MVIKLLSLSKQTPVGGKAWVAKEQGESLVKLETIPK